MKHEISYQIYDPKKPFGENFEGGKTPLLLMEHLRMMDYPISRGISYEKTVDEFLLQLETNDSLRSLRDCESAVVLLNEEGALMRDEQGWELLFSPDQTEGTGMAEETDLYAILRRLLQEEKKDRLCRVRVPERSLKELVSGISPFSILDEYCKTQPGRYLAVAERIVYEGMDEISRRIPVCRYGKLVSIDKEEIENYHTIKALLDDYIHQYDHQNGDSPLQPLSIAVFGAPGCGKSFGVREIAGSSGRFGITALNLSQYHDPAEFFEALREALQCRNSQIPLVFIDEFDSELNGTPRGWLRYFLAPMQDGEFTLNGKRCETSTAVFVFAGATASSFSAFLPHTEEEQEAFQLIKGTDFVSRLKGILNIKGPNPTRPTDKSAVIRRGLLLRDLLVRKCPEICENGIAHISRCLLSAMLGVSEYRHGTRSLEMIVAMSRLSGFRRFTPSCLPVDEQLNLHLKVKDFRRKLEFEQKMGDVVETFAEIEHEHTRSVREQEIRLSAVTEAEAGRAMNDPEMKPWSELDEFYKEGHRSRIRYLGERLEGYDLNIGLRSIQPGRGDAITELYGPTLETLSEIEHTRWMSYKTAEGWRPGKYDRDLKLTPELVPYEELTEETREIIRKSLRPLPLYLKEVGYELYTKSF